MAVIAVRSLVLILILLMLLFFTLVSIMGGIKVGSKATKELCKLKMFEYCKRWELSRYDPMAKPYDWNDKAKGCIDLGYPEPTQSTCEKLTGLANG